MLKKWFVLLLCGIPLLGFAGNPTFHKRDLPKILKIQETGDVLVLRGVALHKHYFNDCYIGAFYSHAPLSDPKQALKDVEAKRMWIYFLQPMSDFRNVM